jgi:hypothetical protein
VSSRLVEAMSLHRRATMPAQMAFRPALSDIFP